MFNFKYISLTDTVLYAWEQLATLYLYIVLDK